VWSRPDVPCQHMNLCRGALTPPTQSGSCVATTRTRTTGHAGPTHCCSSKLCNRNPTSSFRRPKLTCRRNRCSQSPWRSHSLVGDRVAVYIPVRRVIISRMMRIALAFWMTLTALLGPGLCCCTLSPRAFAAATSFASESAPSAVMKRESCCGCDSSKSEQAPAPGNDDRDCPCKKEHGKTAALAESAALPVVRDTPACDPAFMPKHVGVTSDAPSFVERRTDQLFLTSHDLLHAHHVLRC
jgi:hypothetical protein